MSSDAKEQIRMRLDLAEVVGETVSLKPAGRDRLKGLCPFHSERTPSFHVHVGRGFYYCFGCGAKGDLFDFVMQTQSVDFVEALTLLGRRAGVEVEPATPKAGRRRDLLQINQMALDWFRGNLTGEPLDYLRDRGLSDASIAEWELGFAPDGWDGLLRHALTAGHRDDDLLAAGLLSENERGRRYDRFRNRVIFPIKDRLGRAVGFAGRVLDDSVPKYLNTPETDVFDKGAVLYGLDRAKGPIRDRGECLVVEGYMDVIALHQTGFHHAVAALGATLTEDQAQELSRLDVRRLLLAFDADDAGRRAVLAGLERSVGRRFLVRAVTVPHGKDPADAVLGGHVDDFRDALAGGLSEVEFRFQSVQDAHDVRTDEGRRAALEALAPALKPRDVFDPVAAEMRRLVIDQLGIDGARLDAWINARGSSNLSETQVRGMTRRRAAGSLAEDVEVEVMAILLGDAGRLRARLPGVLAALPPELSPSRLREFGAICEEEGFDASRVLARYRERDEGALLFARLFEHGDEREDRRQQTERHLETSLSRLRERVLDRGKEALRERLQERMEEIRELLRTPELSDATLQECYRELGEIQASLAARDAERRLRMPSSRTRMKRR